MIFASTPLRITIFYCDVNTKRVLVIGRPTVTPPPQDGVPLHPVNADTAAQKVRTPFNAAIEIKVSHPLEGIVVIAIRPARKTVVGLDVRQTVRLAGDASIDRAVRDEVLLRQGRDLTRNRPGDESTGIIIMGVLITMYDDL